MVGPTQGLSAVPWFREVDEIGKDFETIVVDFLGFSNTGWGGTGSVFFLLFFLSFFPLWVVGVRESILPPRTVSHNVHRGIGF